MVNDQDNQFTHEIFSLPRQEAVGGLQTSRSTLMRHLSDAFMQNLLMNDVTVLMRN